MQKTTTYNGSFIYDGAIGSMDLDYALTPEGMIETPSTPKYHYFLKDHLGNTRVTISDLNGNGILDPSTEVLQTADYYPFGMRFDNGQGSDNKYLYNGKEMQDDEIEGVNLDWYDYGVKFYNPVKLQKSDLEIRFTSNQENHLEESARARQIARPRVRFVLIF